MGLSANFFNWSVKSVDQVGGSAVEKHQHSSVIYIYIIYIYLHIFTYIMHISYVIELYVSEIFSANFPELAIIFQKLNILGLKLGKFSTMDSFGKTNDTPFNDQLFWLGYG